MRSEILYGEFKGINRSDEAKAYVDYRLVPNSTDFAGVLADLQAISPKFHVDGVAVAVTLDLEIDGDPKDAIMAVSKKFNVTVRRLAWGYKEPKSYFVADIDTGEFTERHF